MSQCSPVWKTGTIKERKGCEDLQRGLNVVRSGRPEQFSEISRLTTVPKRLNVVRSGRPEQYQETWSPQQLAALSQCSPVWKTGTIYDYAAAQYGPPLPSQCSPVWKTGTMIDTCGRHGACRRLNVVRSGRPEQLRRRCQSAVSPCRGVSM